MIREEEHIGSGSGQAVPLSTAADKTERDIGFGHEGFGGGDETIEWVARAVVAGVHDDEFWA